MDEEQSDVLELTRCPFCQSQQLVIYAANEREGLPLMAVCSRCGAHYHEETGWLDSDDL